MSAGSKRLDGHPDVSVILGASDRTHWSAKVIVDFAGGSVAVYGSKDAVALRSWLDQIMGYGRVTRTAWTQDGETTIWEA